MPNTPGNPLVVTSRRVRVDSPDDRTTPRRSRPSILEDAIACLATLEPDQSVSTRDLERWLTTTRRASKIVSEANNTHGFLPLRLIENRAQPGQSGRWALALPVDWHGFDHFMSEFIERYSGRVESSVQEQLHMAEQALAAYPIDAFADHHHLSPPFERAEYLVDRFTDLAETYAVLCQDTDSWERAIEHLSPHLEAQPLLVPYVVEALLSVDPPRPDQARAIAEQTLASDYGQTDPELRRHLLDLIGVAGEGSFVAFHRSDDAMFAARNLLRRIRTLERTGQWSSGAQGVVRKMVAELLTMAATSGRLDLIDQAAWVALTTVEALDQTPVEALDTCLERLTQTFGTDDHRVLLTRSTALLHQMMRCADPAEIRSLADDIAALARRADEAVDAGKLDPATASRVLHAHVHARHEDPDIDARVRVATRRLSYAETAGDRSLIYQSLRHLIPLYFASGQGDQAQIAIDRLRASTTGTPNPRAEAVSLQASLALAQHGPEAAEPVLEHLRDLGSSSEHYSSIAHVQTWWSSVMHADLTGTELPTDQLFVAEIAVSLVGDHPNVAVPFWSIAAYSAVRRSDSLDKARQYLQMLAEHRDRLSTIFGGVLTAAGCVEVAYRLGEHELACRFAECIDPEFDQSILIGVSGTFIMGSTNRFFAIAAAANGGSWLGRTTEQHLITARRGEQTHFGALALLTDRVGERLRA